MMPTAVTRTMVTFTVPVLPDPPNLSDSLLPTKTHWPEPKGLSLETPFSIAPLFRTSLDNIPTYSSGYALAPGSYGLKPALTANIDLVSGFVGKALEQDAGEQTLCLARRLLYCCVQFAKKGDEKYLRDVQSWLQKMTTAEIAAVMRNFATLFHLINQTEREEITRINREREKQASSVLPRTESIADAIRTLADTGATLDEVVRYIKNLDITKTITAHPTEARRRSILRKQAIIGAILAKLTENNLSDAEGSRLVTELGQHIAIMCRTTQVREDRMTVADEVETGVYYGVGAIWDSVSGVYGDLRAALIEYYGAEAAAVVLDIFLRYHSWIGSDRDGHPGVTNEVTRATLATQRQAAGQRHVQGLEALGRQLTISDRLAKAPAQLVASLAADESVLAVANRLDAEVKKHLRHEPFRLKVAYIIEKIKLSATLVDKINNPDLFFYSSDDFIVDLELLQASLVEAGLQSIAEMESLNALIIQAKTFGFYTFTLDVRQHSDVHELAVAEIILASGCSADYTKLDETGRAELLTRLLDDVQSINIAKLSLSSKTRDLVQTFTLMRETMKLEPRAFKKYIVSMAHGPSDVLEVMFLAKLCGLENLDFVPLFETIGDLKRAKDIMAVLFVNPVYVAHLRARGLKQEIMQGYSDGNKDGGKFMADLALFLAQDELAQVCERYGVRLMIFHGRGGSVGRGGGPAIHSILSLHRRVQNGRINFTEQGEVLANFYGSNSSARRHMEQIVYAMIVSQVNARTDDTNISPGFLAVGERAYAAYRELIDDAEFWPWYTAVTPVRYIGDLPTASRPISRKPINKIDFDGLRAIPWVFSWTQTRFNVPGWYGVGTALSEYIAAGRWRLPSLRRRYQKSHSFKRFIDSTQRELARARLEIAHLYAETQPGKFEALIVDEYNKTFAAILAITQQSKLLEKEPVIKRSIEFRNPITDALNLGQIELMRRMRELREDADEAQRDELKDALFLSLVGIAAAMQNTG